MGRKAITRKYEVEIGVQKGRRRPQSRWEDTASPGLRMSADSDGRKNKRRGERQKQLREVTQREREAGSRNAIGLRTG